MTIIVIDSPSEILSFLPFLLFLLISVCSFCSAGEGEFYNCSPCGCPCMERPRALLPFGCSPGTPQGRNSLCPVLKFNVSTRLRLPSVYVLQRSGPAVHLVLMVAASLSIFAYFPPACMLFELHAQQTHARSFSLGRDHRGDLHPR